jgi:Ca2+-binding RTX toxin-like protein
MISFSLLFRVGETGFSSQQKEDGSVMRTNLRSSFPIGMVVALGSVWAGLLSPLPAVAGTVHLEGSVVVYKAGNNEKNTLVVNARGSARDPSSGRLVQGFTVSDATASLFGGPGCQILSGTALCDITSPSAVSIDLGDKDDKVSQTENEPGNAVPMHVKGGPGNDVILGSSAADDLDGERGDDTIDGGAGNDVLEGGFGDDTITGGPGRDSISGGPGKDHINARDGEVDNINCGLGRDVVSADANDVKKRCN